MSNLSLPYTIEVRVSFKHTFRSTSANKASLSAEWCRSSVARGSKLFADGSLRGCLLLYLTHKFQKFHFEFKCVGKNSGHTHQYFTISSLQNYPSKPAGKSAKLINQYSIIYFTVLSPKIHCDALVVHRRLQHRLTILLYVELKILHRLI